MSFVRMHIWTCWNTQLCETGCSANSALHNSSKTYSK